MNYHAAGTRGPRAPVQILLMGLAGALLWGCASGAQNSGLAEQLRFDIHADGTKFFTYALALPVADQRARAALPPRPGERPAARRGVDIEGLLETRISETGYCREGYFILQRSGVGGPTSLRGECREGASPADRERFAGGERRWR